jgi:hypothetical protein
VDKTQLALNLIQGGKYYFLSRPRRFGKSLFLDTLKELFEGNQPLFKDLAVHPHWDWAVKYPVLRFSFGRKNYITSDGLEESLHQQLTSLERTFHIYRQFEDAGSRFADLIELISEKEGKPVVILVNEYDKPILDALTSSKAAKRNRDFLHGFYGTIKDYDAHIRFAFFYWGKQILEGQFIFRIE